MLSILDHLIDQLEPDYAGYEGQYKAVLYALGIDPDASARIVHILIHGMNVDPETSTWEPGLKKRGQSIFELLVHRLKPKYENYEDQYKEILMVLDIDPDTRASDVLKYLSIIVE